MNSLDFNRKVWEATIQAQFQLAGVRGFDPKTQAFLIPSGSVQNDFPGLTSQTPTAVELANFNSQLYSLADQMQPASAVQWAPTTNRRYANYGVYLDYADPGANGAGAYQVAYNIALTNYSNELKVWSPIKEAAQTAFQNAKTSKNFDDWVHNDYVDSDTYSNEETTVGELKSTLTIAASKFYGPLWKTLSADRDDYELGSKKYSAAATLGYNMDCGSDGFNPAYNINRKDWATTYTGWLAQATKNPPPKPSASATITIDSSSSTDLTQYGITTVHAENSSFFDFPFFFWGEGTYSSVTERQSMYEKLNFNQAKITMTSLTQPVSIPITPGKWYSTDLTTTFPNLLGGAPANPGTLMYPYAATIVLAYNVSYQVTLDSSVYKSLKTTTTTNTSSQTVVGFLGWIFSETGATYNNRTVSSLSQISFDDNSNTVTINPDNNGIPTVLGIIVGKDPAGPKPDNSPGAVIQPSPQNTALALLSATKAFILDFNSFFSSLTRPQRATIVSAIKRVLNASSSDFQPLINAIDDVVSGSRVSDDDEFNEVILEQFFKNSSLTITVKNASGMAIKEQDDAVLELSPEAQQLVTLLGSQDSSGKANSYVRIAQTLLLRALASLARIKNPATLQAKESLVQNLVQELTALAVSSELTIQDSNSEPVLVVPQYIAQAPLTLTFDGMEPVQHPFSNNTLWDSDNSPLGVALLASRNYRVDILGAKQGCVTTSIVKIESIAQPTWRLYNLQSQWDAAAGLHFFTFNTGNQHRGGAMTVSLDYHDPVTGVGLPLPVAKRPNNPMTWALRA